LVVDVNQVDIDNFDDIDYGLDNIQYNILQIGKSYKLAQNLYVKSVEQFKDLFTLVTYTPTTNVGNNNDTIRKSGNAVNIVPKYFRIWEKDIVLSNPVLQEHKIPTKSNIIKAIEPIFGENNLAFSDQLGVDTNLTEKRKIKTFSGISYVDMGTVNNKRLKFTDLTSICVKTNQNDFSYTFSIKLDAQAKPNSGSYVFGDYTIHSFVKDMSAYSALSVSTSCNGSDFIHKSSFPNNIPLFGIGTQDSSAYFFVATYNISGKTISTTIIDTSGNQNQYSLGSFHLKEDEYNTFAVNVNKIKAYNTTTSKYLCNIDLYGNGQTISGGIRTFIFGSDAGTTLSVNPSGKFSGSIGYIESRNNITNDYLACIHNILTNKTWVNLSAEMKNKRLDKYQNYSRKRTVTFQNLSQTTSSICVPIVLRGTAYNLVNYSDINSNVIRTYTTSTPVYFDFSNVDVVKRDFVIVDGISNKPVPFKVMSYDEQLDELIIYVILNRYVGQNLYLYYNNKDINAMPTNVFGHTDFYNIYAMDAFKNVPITEYDNATLFNGNDEFMALDSNGYQYLLRIDEHKLNGDPVVNKTHLFDVAYDDRITSSTDISEVEMFIKDVVNTHKPDIMKINQVRSKYNYILETNNIGS
jgi:hypothetical protein